MGVKVDYFQLNIIDFEIRYSINVFEVILNMLVFMGIVLEWLLFKRDVQGIYVEDLVVFMQLIQILVRN